MGENKNYHERKAKILKNMADDLQSSTPIQKAPIIKVVRNTSIEIKLANIIELDVTAIVNAAQPRLSGGAGVDGAIHFGGGPAILEECKKIIKKIGRLDTGKAVITTGGELPAKYVIHTVGPIWEGGEKKEAELLAACYRECMILADKESITSIGFPAISTGAYSYPVLYASEVALHSVKDYLDNTPTGIKRMVFAVFSHSVMGAYRRAAMKIL